MPWEIGGVGCVGAGTSGNGLVMGAEGSKLLVWDCKGKIIN